MDATTKLARALSREVKTARKFAGAVRAAYAANGWHSGRGRPVKGEDKRQPVPATVKTYVWEVKRALTAGLKVWTYRTFYELRRAMAARHLQLSRRHTPLSALDPELQGIRLVHPKQFTGHLLHDLAVTFTKVPAERRDHLKAALLRLVKQYAPAAAKAHTRVVQATAQAAANDAAATAREAA
jgi:hypothetical protein